MDTLRAIFRQDESFCISFCPQKAAEKLDRKLTSTSCKGCKVSGKNLHGILGFPLGQASQEKSRNLLESGRVGEIRVL